MAFAPAPALTPGVTARTMAVAFREIATLLHAGVTLDQALSGAAHGGPLHFRQALMQLGAAVGQGTPCSVAMKSYGGLFNPIVPAIISAGEMTGNLDGSFTLLAEFFEAEDQLRRTIQSAMVYPTIVVIVAILAVGILSWIGFMPGTWAVRLLWAVGIAVGAWLLLRFRVAQRLARYAAMLLPFFGTIMQQLAVARFCYTFGLLTRAGVPYLEGLQATQPAVQHPVVERAVSFLYAGVRNGNTIEDGLRAQPVFPPVVLNLVASGETAGSLDDALLRAAAFLRNDAEYKIKNASKFAGPVMLVILGIIVALILISFWSSYFDQVMSIMEE